MMAYYQIILFQYIPLKIKKILLSIIRVLSIKFNSSNNNNNNIFEINYFNINIKKEKRALISLSPQAWLTAIQQYPNIKLFNITGLTYEIVKALNENGYIVDIVDNRFDFIPTKKYDLFIGHGGKCQKIIDNLSEDTIIIQYVSGAYWKTFYSESKERYDDFRKRKDITRPLLFKRRFDDLISGEEYLTEKAHILFSLNCPRMSNSYGEHKHKFFYTGLGAYLDEKLLVPISEKNFKEGVKNFIYVAGTNGNIQKGLDLILEVFSKTPHLNLYIYCLVEEEVLKYYKKELNLKNIHYIYHWRFKPFHTRLKELIKRVNFTIHAPINTGVGTAFSASVGVGLIPVGYIDIIDNNNFSVLTNSWDVDSLMNCVLRASEKSPEWCMRASELAIKYYNENWSVENFRKKFNELIEFAEKKLYSTTK